MKKEADEVMPEMIELSEDVDGNAYLEGMKPSVVKEVYDAAIEFEGDKSESEALKKRLAASKKKLIEASKKHKSFFTQIGSQLEYNVGGIVVNYNHKESDAIKTRREEMAPVDAENAKAVTALKGGGRKKKDAAQTPADVY